MAGAAGSRGQIEILLRDGSVVMIRPTVASDRDAVQRFFHELTPDSLHQRFFITAEPTSDVVARFCDSSRAQAEPHIDRVAAADWTR